MTKHRSREARREQILDAARDCFIEKGYVATRMDEIAHASELSKGGIYFHFDSKKDILQTLVQREYGELMDLLEEVSATEADDSLEEVFLEVGRMFIERFESSDNPRFMAIIAEMALRDHDIRRLLLDIQHTYIDRTADVIECGIEAGRVRNVDPESAAVFLKALIDGLEAVSGLGYEMDVEKLVSTAITILEGGLIAERFDDDLDAQRELDEEES